ncbi:hypothetical protein KP509_06G053800 [Ceratopteris richardii]|nr:hypothetical protein KP509_06G053800 [Ceratopteris richardii]
MIRLGEARREDQKTEKQKMLEDMQKKMEMKEMGFEKTRRELEEKVKDLERALTEMQGKKEKRGRELEEGIAHTFEQIRRKLEHTEKARIDAIGRLESAIGKRTLDVLRKYEQLESTINQFLKTVPKEDEI